MTSMTCQVISIICNAITLTLLVIMAIRTYKQR